MAEDTQTDGRSSLRTVALLALMFAVGYVVGSRSGPSEDWQDVPDEPTEITIDGDEDDE